MSKDSTVPASRVSTWIPQLYFDVIGRLVPGAVLLVCLPTAVIGTSRLLGLVKDPDLRSLPLTMLLGLGLAASYSLAIVIWGFASGIVRLALKIGALLRSLLGFLPSLLPFQKQKAGAGIDEPASVTKSRTELDYETLIRCRDLAGKYEKVKKQDPVAGSRMTKLKAEIHFATTLAAGLALASFLSLSSLGSAQPSVEMFVLFGLGSLGSLISLAHFSRRLYQIVMGNCQASSAEEASLVENHHGGDELSPTKRR